MIIRISMTIFGNTIKTPRLVLRKVDEEDIPLLVDWSNSEVAHGEYLTPDRISVEQCRKEHLAGMHWNEQKRAFIIEVKNGLPIGTIHYWIRPEQHHCGVMALKIAEQQYRSNGYGTEAQKYIIIHLMQRVKLAAVEMYTDIDNISQQRCLHKLGFELVKSLQYADGGVKRTGHLYRLDAEHFRNTPMYHFHYE
ncbi:GNAT family N-acetyltransferase [Desulfopila aestuarii]|uniref:Protein N-acetyltransferase, RimJ/RimL family n=1 Tax=Desulfopila aestuarii DSM 18488 TaxID=1121416 RepID=A0A1M7Y5W9_9BACT|nr:GNAT family N-acetyltransferase [Desulfopila aestuarii]SHO47962.1 Protein N-acetyltransferase, RimJ/RimL family [Desulfopila aestuarii DSM 18488]